jgi:hypothetical protein
MNKLKATMLEIELHWRLFRMALGLVAGYCASAGLFHLGIIEGVRAARPQLADSWMRASEIFASTALCPPILAAAVTASIHRATPGAMMDGLVPSLGCICIWGPPAYFCSEAASPGMGVRLALPCLITGIIGSFLAARYAATRGRGRSALVDASAGPHSGTGRPTTPPTTR